VDKAKAVRYSEAGSLGGLQAIVAAVLCGGPQLFAKFGQFEQFFSALFWVLARSMA